MAKKRAASAADTNTPPADNLAALKELFSTLTEEKQVDFVRWAEREFPAVARYRLRMQDRQTAILENMGNRLTEMALETQHYEENAKPRKSKRDKEAAHLRHEKPRYWIWKKLGTEYYAHCSDPEGAARKQVTRYMQTHPEEFI